MRYDSTIIILHVAVQLPQHHSLKRLSFPYCVFLVPSSQISWLSFLLGGRTFKCGAPWWLPQFLVVRHAHPLLHVCLEISCFRVPLNVAAFGLGPWLVLPAFLLHYPFIVSLTFRFSLCACQSLPVMGCKPLFLRDLRPWKPYFSWAAIAALAHSQSWLGKGVPRGVQVEFRVFLCARCPP